MYIMMRPFGLFLPTSSILLLCISFPIVLGMASGNETDRLALLAFKDQIIDDPLHVTRSWNDSLHFCEWQGITCGRRHPTRVIMLNLESKKLGGSISPSIGNLSFLRIINLNHNNFQGNVPQEFGRLFRLEIFNMSYNFLVGEIPASLSNCSNLKILRLPFNSLTGKIPINITSLYKLLVFSIASNNINGGIPASLGNFSSLTILSLTQNNLGGSIPNSLGQLKNLNFLAIGENNLYGTIPPSLYNISSLQKFSVPVNRLTGSFPPDIGLILPNLRVFFVGGNYFFGPIPMTLFNVSSLEEVDIAQNNFTGKVPIEVGNLKGLNLLNLEFNYLGYGKADDLNFFNYLINSTNLKVLSISGNDFGGKLPNSVANLSNQLGKLLLGGNEIFGSIPSEIGNLANLFYLSMSYNFLTGSIPSGVGMLQKLQYLGLEVNTISGQIPSSLGNISQLYHLDLSHNILEGKIISDIGKCHLLKELHLSKNKLNGVIPKQIIGSSTQLISISLDHNSLNGPLPLEVGNMKSLGKLDVSNNKISGEIPSTLGSCLSLEYIYLHGNFFQGPIPPSLSSLKGIQELDLSMNNLSGQIPKDLAYITAVKFLNMSFNDLDGEVPINGVFQNASAFSIDGNSKLCGGIPELHLRVCSIKKSMKKGISPAFKVVIAVILSSVIVASFLVLYWRRKSRPTSSSPHSVGEWYENISYNGLHKATGGFSSTNLIGVGSFGSVYKGVRENGMLVAVKVFNLMETGASKSFIIECKALREVRHRNLLKILTVCSSMDFEGNDFKALVLKFMPNGSLENWLHPSSDEQYLSRNLNLFQRLNIAIDVASALDYLHNHCQTPIVHCDLKPSNILLDNDMTAVVGDFGFSKFLKMRSNNFDKSDTSSIYIKGTIGYIPPEYGVAVQVSTQGDVYSYGILLLEMFTGKRPTDNMFKDGLSIHHFFKMTMDERVMEIVDPRILLEEDRDEDNFDDGNQRCNIIEKIRECLISIIKVGVACSMESPGGRMDINDVLVELHKIKEVFLGTRIHG